MSRLGAHTAPPAATGPADALRRLMGRGSIYTLGLAVQMVAGVAIVPVVTRLLDPSAFGEVATALVVQSALAIVGACGMPEAAARTFFQGETGPRAAHRLVVSSLGCALAVGLVAELTGPLWAPAFGLEYDAVMRLAVVCGVATASMLGSLALLRAADRVWLFLTVTITAAVGGQASGLVLTWLSPSAESYLTGVAAGTALAALLGMTLSGSLRHPPAIGRPLKDALGLGLPIVPHSMAVLLLGGGDRVAIVATLGLTQAGRYQVAYAVGNVGLALMTAVNQAWLPLLLGADESSRPDILRATSRAVHRGAVIVAGGLALGAPLALLVAAPPSYDRAALVPVSAVVAFSILPYATLSTFFHIVFLSGKTKVMAVAAPVAAAVNLGLNFALLPYTGIVGSALVTAFAYALLAVIIGVAARRRMAVPGLTADAVKATAVAIPIVAAGALLPETVAGDVARGLGCVALLVAAGAMALKARAPAARLRMPGPRPFRPRRVGPET